MPPTDNQGGSFLGRSIMSIRRNQVASMESGNEHDIELFSKHIAERFNDLSEPAGSDAHDPALLSLHWLRKLLDAFLCCEAEFKAMLLLRHSPTHLARAPFDRLISDLLDRSVKALDVCNAVSHGIDSLLLCHKHAQIAAAALHHSPLCEGHFRRAKKALSIILEDKETNSRTTERSWSFGRRSAPASSTVKERHSHLRLPLTVSKTWSAGKQVHAMASNLNAPRGAEMNSMALPIYTMATILAFLAWVFVAAIPCQDRRSLTTYFPAPPRHLPWAEPMISLHEKVTEEWRKKEKKGCTGLMDELQRLEKCANWLVEFRDSNEFPLEGKLAEEVRAQADDLTETCKIMEEELIPLQRQIREVFHRIVRSRTELLEYMGQGARVLSPIS